MERIRQWFGRGEEAVEATTAKAREAAPEKEGAAYAPPRYEGYAPPPPRPLRETWEQVRTSSPQELRESALETYRREPLPFLAAAFLVGFGAGKLLFRDERGEE